MLREASSKNIKRIQKFLGVDLEDINAQLSSEKNSQRNKSNHHRFYSNDENINFKYNSVKNIKECEIKNNSNILYEQSPTENKYVVNYNKYDKYFNTILGDSDINKNSNIDENIVTKKNSNPIRKFSNLNKNKVSNFIASSNSQKSDKYTINSFKVSKFPPPLNIAYNKNLLEFNINNKNKETLFLSETNDNKKFTDLNSEIIKEGKIGEVMKSLDCTKKIGKKKERSCIYYQKNKHNHKIILGSSKLKEK